MRAIVMLAALLAAGVSCGTANAEPSQIGAGGVAAVIGAAGPEKMPSAGALKPDAATTADAPATAGQGATVQGATGQGAGQSVASTPPSPPPSPTLLIDIDLTKQRMIVTENGKAKYTWPISSGREGYRTPTGTFRPQWMAKMWYSKQYDDAPMPHSVFFKGGVAMHGTYATGMLGRPASHGCIRLAPANAATIYGLVSSHGKAMTRIKVFGEPRDNTPVASKRQDRTPGATRRDAYASERYARQTPPRYYTPPRYSYNNGWGGAAYGSPRYVYPGDAPYGYRPARPVYRPYPGPYAGRRVYYD